MLITININVTGLSITLNAKKYFPIAFVACAIITDEKYAQNNRSWRAKRATNVIVIPGSRVIRMRTETIQFATKRLITFLLVPSLPKVLFIFANV